MLHRLIIKVTPAYYQSYPGYQSYLGLRYEVLLALNLEKVMMKNLALTEWPCH